jgi:hypothetical protein
MPADVHLDSPHIHRTQAYGILDNFLDDTAASDTRKKMLDKFSTVVNGHRQFMSNSQVGGDQWAAGGLCAYVCHPGALSMCTSVPAVLVSGCTSHSSVTSGTYCAAHSPYSRVLHLLLLPHQNPDVQPSFNSTLKSLIISAIQGSNYR